MMSEALLMNGYDSALPSGFTEVIFADIVTTAPDPFADIVTTAPDPFADIVTTAPDPFADIVTTAPDPFADIVTTAPNPFEGKGITTTEPILLYGPPPPGVVYPSELVLAVAFLAGAYMGGISVYVWRDTR